MRKRLDRSRTADLLFAPIALGFGMDNLRHGRKRHGWAQIILAVVLFLVGVIVFG